MIKEIWSDDDFTDMGWHDCRLYGIKLPNEKFNFSFDLDYIFRWIKSGDQFDGFDVAPCVLTFFNVSRLKIDLNYQENLLCFISDIKRGNMRPSPNGKFLLHNYTIECDAGNISFSATGFEQRVKSVPIRSENQDLKRENLVIE